MNGNYLLRMRKFLASVAICFYFVYVLWNFTRKLVSCLVFYRLKNTQVTVGCYALCARKRLCIRVGFSYNWVGKFELFTYTRVKIGFDCLFTYDSVIDLRGKLVMIVLCMWLSVNIPLFTFRGYMYFVFGGSLFSVPTFK